MATDQPRPVRPCAGRADDASTLAADVHHRCRAVIDSELRRLARRAPLLRQNELEIIDTALDDLADTLLLARLRQTSQHATQLTQLFGVPTEDA